jgi:hypothetical protein
MVPEYSYSRLDHLQAAITAKSGTETALFGFKSVVGSHRGERGI